MNDMNLSQNNQNVPGDTFTSKKPFYHSFLSKLGIRYLTQSALVIILLLTTLIVNLIDTNRCIVRDEAFKQIAKAEQSGDFSGIIQGAEKFFSVNPLTNNDEREPYVKELYDKSIIRLFAEQNEKPDDKALEHFKRYRQLIVDQKK
ncbi:MAG: hypothetical protein MUF15_14590 [Acidobacteria bacterium]|jgi:hypothetical protein|nr:hypothetical protein [Acidobacteriota bacterium]